MRFDGTCFQRVLSSVAFGTAAVVFVTLATATAARADEKAVEIPEAYRGTWLLRLTSDDGGKSYKSGDGKPICMVSGKEIRFVRKVEFSDEKLVVKSVTKTDPGNATAWTIEFENGKTWLLSENSGSITARIHDRDGEKLTEKYRITIRK